MNMFKEESEPTSEVDIQGGIKINVENPSVSASTLLDFFNQLQVRKSWKMHLEIDIFTLYFRDCQTMKSRVRRLRMNLFLRKTS